MSATPLADDGDAKATLDRLWHEFRDDGSSPAREELVSRYLRLVTYVASRVATGLPGEIERADLVSYGIFGLHDALDRYDPSWAITFEAYAIPRIKGAMIDELRALDWVPRSVRFKAREIDNAYAELESTLKRAPTETEVAQHLGVSVSELRDIVNQISFATQAPMTAPSPAMPVDAQAKATLDRLWHEFKDDSSFAARAQLIDHFLPLVRSVVSLVATALPASVERARLDSYGIHGLYDALETFDLASGIAFETYATPRIRDAIIHELRTLDLVPRLMSFEAPEQTMTLRGGMAGFDLLTEQEKIVVTLFYFEGLTLAEIGDVLGVTESRVVQIHAKAVDRLRGKRRKTDS